MKYPGDPFLLPADKQPLLQRAKRLEWVTLLFMLSIIAAISATMGASQTMKAMWTEDLLSLIPPIAFLFSARYRDKAPDEAFPYGYRRAVLVAFLAGAVALFGFGLYLLVDSLVKLFMAERPSIQTVGLFGRRVWLGWLMIAALVYSVVPPFILGRLKLPIARDLHDKAIHTDANINRGDWLAGAAGVLGLLGIAYGFWWADSVAAGIISVEILRDGFADLRNSVAQLMNKRPTDVAGTAPDLVTDEVRQQLERLDWVREARVRLREDGEVLTGEAFVVPRDDDDGMLDKIKQATDTANSVDWRLHDINVVLVSAFE